MAAAVEVGCERLKEAPCSWQRARVFLQEIQGRERDRKMPVAKPLVQPRPRPRLIVMLILSPHSYPPAFYS